VTVSKPNRAPVTARVSVTVEAIPVPHMNILQAYSTVDSHGIPKYGPSDRIALVGSSDISDVSYSWTITYESGNTSQSGEAVYIPQELAPLGTSSSGFVLLPPTAIDNGAGAAVLVPSVVYTATLRGVALASGAVGSASVTMVINQPPQSGTCHACRYISGSVQSDDCVTVGTALLDTFRVSCSAWADEDQPLRYRFGQRGSDGTYDWFDYMPDTYRDLRLPSGTVVLLSQVFDSLGAGTSIMTSAITVNSLGDVRRSTALQAQFTTVVGTVNTFAYAGRADIVNQMSYSSAAEVDHSVGRGLLAQNDAVENKLALVKVIDGASSRAALTVGFAEETSTAASQLAQV